jgi:hypothetical protein
MRQNRAKTESQLGSMRHLPKRSLSFTRGRIYQTHPTNIMARNPDTQIDVAARASKLNRTLKWTAFISIFVGFMIFWFSYYAYHNLVRPQKGDHITFEMYAQLFKILSGIVFLALPLIGAFLIYSSLVVLHCWRKCTPHRTTRTVSLSIGSRSWDALSDAAARCFPGGRFEALVHSQKDKKPKRDTFRLLNKAWRRPTLAEAIQPLPSAMRRLTAVFGMGTGRTTALWSPENHYRS